MTTCLVQPCSSGNKGGTLIAAFSDQNQVPVDSASKRLQHMRYGPIAVIRAFIERNGAFSDILHTNPHLVGRSHPVSVEVREFDWDSSRKGASQLSRIKTIRLSTPPGPKTCDTLLFFTLKIIIFRSESQRHVLMM